MVSLLDIAPATEKVSVAGQSVDVLGVSAKGIAAVMSRFPQVRELMGGRDLKLTPDDIMALAPEAIAAIIAAGTGHPGEKDHEEVASNLPVETQLNFIEAILKVSLPGGALPFVERLRGMAKQAGFDILEEVGEAGVSGKEVDGKSPKQSKA